jgi:hypothetical protein
VAKQFTALPDNYDRDAVYARYQRAREASIDLLLVAAPRVKALLTKDQIRKLPDYIASALNKRYLTNIRSGTAGGGGGMMIPGGGAMVMSGGMGGGATTMIMRQ